MSVKKNVIANYVGRILVTLLSIVFIPIYIKYIGIESYGLIGIYSMMLAMMMLVDMGMGQTVVQEVARYSSTKLSLKEILDTLKTFKYIYFIIGFFTFIGIYFFSDLIVLKWLNIESLSFETSLFSIKIIAAMIFISWLSILYRNAIIGLQHQVWLNMNDVFFALVSKVGVLFVLVYISSSISSFLLYQLCIVIIQLIVMIVKLNLILPKKQYQPEFSVARIQRLWKFTSGVAITTLFGTLISQADRLILSIFLSLKTFGLYTVASVVGKSLGNVIAPITLAIRPRLTVLYENRNEVDLIEFYHKSAQLMSIVSIPIGIVLILFSKEILWIWTGDRILVDELWLIVSMLVIGTMLNGMMRVPYSLQLSAGWTSLSAKSNIVLFFTITPLLVYGVKQYGMIAAPTVWLIVNFMYVVIIIHYMHKRLLKNEEFYWYKYDILYILVPSLVIGILCKLIIMSLETNNKLLILGELFISYVFITIGAVLSSNKYRDDFINLLRKKNA